MGVSSFALAVGPMSNIRVSVHWERSTIFAGEDLNCTITFKNIAAVSGRSRSTSPNPQSRGVGPARDRWKSTLPINRSLPVSQPPSTRLQGRGHRSTSSLNSPVRDPRRASPTLPSTVTETPKDPLQRHKRSVSIISISNGSIAGEEVHKNISVKKLPGLQKQPPGRGHVRSASLQGVSQRTKGPYSGIPGSPKEGGVTGAAATNRSSTLPFMLTRSSLSSQQPMVNSPQEEDHMSNVPSDSLNSKKPVASDGAKPITLPSTITGVSTPNDPSTKILSKPESLAGRDDINERDTIRAQPRVLSPASISGTPRSSLDLYSTSNNSTETLASEYVAPTPSLNRPSFRTGHTRQPSRLSPIKHSNRPPETLMMGYVQLMGSFTLDGSLVNLAPFETIKRKGVIGGQGSGGVVGLETPKRNSGLFGALGWSNIGESLGGFLGPPELSTIREMKGIASTKSVPILSTSQSILFVDLKLGPGESRSYVYSHPLPRGIPPTHRGRAMRVAYHLVVGTQRAQSVAQQHLVRHVDIPFRVLPGVNRNGEILGHDLMNPHVILKNIARSRSVGHNLGNSQQSIKNETVAKSITTANDFLSYVKTLLERPQYDGTLGLLSPTEPTAPNSLHIDSENDVADASMKEIIDIVIQNSNSSISLKRSANRFQIQRGKDRVAAISLSRPAYRLGETISAAIDFQDADITCYSLYASLESSEVVDPAIALRSSASIYRATRRIHASWSDHTACTNRAVFEPMIPIYATPEFNTSGVQLEWKLRFEFVTSLTAHDERNGNDSLLEEVANDERGRILAATQTLPCESFDVSVPIKIYGAVCAAEEQHEVGDFSI